MASGDLNRVGGSVVQLEANGASITDGSFAQANDNDLLTSANAGYPWIDFMLSATWATSTDIEDGAVHLYRRKMNVETGGGDEPTPDAVRPREYVGSFYPDAVTSEQFMTIDNVPRSLYQEQYYIENQTGQTASSGWVLEATPVTINQEA